MIPPACKADIWTMGSTDQVTFANTVLLVVMGVTLILIVVGLGLFGYRYQRTQAERRSQEMANLAAIRFEVERAKAVRETQPEILPVAEGDEVVVEDLPVPELPADRASRRKPSNPDNLPRHSLR